MNVKRLKTTASPSLQLISNLILGSFLLYTLIPPASLMAQTGGTITGTISVRGLRDAKDVIVYVEKIPEAEFSPSDEHSIMDQINLTFVPHVLPVIVGTAVDFPNNDEVRHNVFTPSEAGNEFHLGIYPKGTVKTVSFDKPGVVTLLCNIHAEMSAYILVVETPYSAVTHVEPGERAGQYILENVPPGNYVLKAWHRRASESEQTVEVKDGQAVTVDFSIRRK